VGNRIIKKTAKRKQEVSLPANPDIVFIPNRVTNAKYNYTLIQEKIFNYVLFNLQEAIKLSMNGREYQQLELFKTEEDGITLKIPMSNITIPQNYKDVREAAENLQKTIIRIIEINKETGKKEAWSLTLFGEVGVPVETERNSLLQIKMSKKVAKLLVQMDLNREGKPGNYTSFLLQVATGAKNKYTARIYKKIASWKEKGGFYQTIEEFRDWLELGEKYKNFIEIKRNILIPVQKELQGKADCWFNCAEKTFENRVGKKVVGINWKVITPAFEEAIQIKADNFRNMLRMHVHFKDDDINQLEPILSRDFDLSAITLRFMEIRDYIAANKDKIENPKAYLIKSLLKEFAP
jgi:hypothetical protein